MEGIDSWGALVTKPTGRPRGRPKGAKSKPKLPALKVVEAYARAEETVARVAEEPPKLSPLDVMLANMDWTWTKVAPVLMDIAEDKSNPPDVRLNAVKEAQMLRDRVQGYAKDAAQYCHAKLHAVAPPAVAKPDIIEIDPLREHLEEMARVFKLKLQEVA